MIGNQRRVLRGILSSLRPFWRSDRALPARIERLLRGDRRLGSRDRRLYRELIYATVRHLNWIEPWLDLAEDFAPFAEEAIAWLAADLPATHAFRTEVLAPRPPLPPWPPCPPTIQEKARDLASIAANRLPPQLLSRGLALAEPHASLCPPAQDSPAADSPANLHPRFAPAPLPSLLPAWAGVECPVAAEPAEYDALHRRAPLWLRIAESGIDPAALGEAGAPLAEFADRGWRWRPSGVLPGAVRVDSEADVTATAAFAAGRFEIQDLGSQLVLAAVQPAAGGRWLDACAGAGGKSLQLAALLGPRGRVHVHDIRPAALAELAERARRAGLDRRILRVTTDGAKHSPGARGNFDAPSDSGGSSNFDRPDIPGGSASYGGSGDTRGSGSPEDSGGSGFSSRSTGSCLEPAYDGVLVDAPCSGTGTWRRFPHLKAVTTPLEIASAAGLQLRLLTEFASRVRPGGFLIYATCSLCPRENEAVAEGFLASSPSFRPEPPARSYGGRPAGPGVLFLPSRHDTDGFFVASFRRNP